MSRSSPPSRRLSMRRCALKRRTTRFTHVFQVNVEAVVAQLIAAEREPKSASARMLQRYVNAATTNHVLAPGAETGLAKRAALVTWMIKRGIAFSAVLDSDFARFMTLSQQQPIAKNEAEEVAGALYAFSMDMNARALANAESVVLGFDFWEEKHTDQYYLGIVASAVTSVWEPVNACIGLVPVSVNHFSETVAAIVDARWTHLFADRNLREPLLSLVVSDSEASALRAGRLLSGGVDDGSEGCVVHQLALACADAMGNGTADRLKAGVGAAVAGQDLVTVHTVVVEISSSSTKARALDMAQRGLNVDDLMDEPLRIIKPLAARWLYIVRAVRRFIDLKEALLAMAVGGDITCAVVDEALLRRLESYTPVLKIAEVAMLRLQREANSGAAVPSTIAALLDAFKVRIAYVLCRPHIYLILTQVDITTETPVVAALKTAFRNAVEARLGRILTNPRGNFLKAAAVTIAYHNLPVKNDITEAVWASLANDDARLFSGADGYKRQMASLAIPELRRRLDTLCADHTTAKPTDAAFWSQPRNLDIAAAAPIVQMYQAIPAGAIARRSTIRLQSLTLLGTPHIERMFSGSGFIVSSRRASLACSHVESLTVAREFVNSPRFNAADFLPWFSNSVAAMAGAKGP